MLFDWLCQSLVVKLSFWCTVINWITFYYRLWWKKSFVNLVSYRFSLHNVNSCFRPKRWYRPNKKNIFNELWTICPFSPRDIVLPAVFRLQQMRTQISIFTDEIHISVTRNMNFMNMNGVNKLIFDRCRSVRWWFESRQRCELRRTGDWQQWPCSKMSYMQHWALSRFFFVFEFTSSIWTFVISRNLWRLILLMTKT